MKAFAFLVIALCAVIVSAVPSRFTPYPPCEAEANYENPKNCLGSRCQTRKCRYRITEAVVSSDPPKMTKLAKDETIIVDECRSPYKNCRPKKSCTCQHEFEWKVIEGYITVYPGPGNYLKRAMSIKRKLLARVPVGCKCGYDTALGRCRGY